MDPNLYTCLTKVGVFDSRSQKARHHTRVQEISVVEEHFLVIREIGLLSPSLEEALEIRSMNEANVAYLVYQASHAFALHLKPVSNLLERYFQDNSEERHFRLFMIIRTSAVFHPVPDQSDQSRCLP